MSTDQLNAMNEARQRQALFDSFVDRFADASRVDGAPDMVAAPQSMPMTAGETSSVVYDLAALELAEATRPALPTPKQQAARAMKSSEDMVEVQLCAAVAWNLTRSYFVSAALCREGASQRAAQGD